MSRAPGRRPTGVLRWDAHATVVLARDDAEVASWPLARAGRFDLAMVERLCNTVIVMALGRVIAEGSMAELRENPAVVDAYLGEG